MELMQKLQVNQSLFPTRKYYEKTFQTCFFVTFLWASRRLSLWWRRYERI